MNVLLSECIKLLILLFPITINYIKIASSWPSISQNQLEFHIFDAVYWCGTKRFCKVFSTNKERHLVALKGNEYMFDQNISNESGMY